MERRTFMNATLGAAALACAAPWIDCRAHLSDSFEHALVLIDPTWPVSRAYAAASAVARGDVLEVGADIGALWHSRLRDWPGTIAGALRPSDCFVLRSLSIADGRAFRSVPIDERPAGVPERALLVGRSVLRTRAVAFEIGAALPARR